MLNALGARPWGYDSMSMAVAVASEAETAVVA